MGGNWRARENPSRHGENVLTPHGHGPSWESNFSWHCNEMTLNEMTLFKDLLYRAIDWNTTPYTLFISVYFITTSFYLEKIINKNGNKFKGYKWKVGPHSHPCFSVPSTTRANFLFLSLEIFKACPSIQGNVPVFTGGSTPHTLLPLICITHRLNSISHQPLPLSL